MRVAWCRVAPYTRGGVLARQPELLHLGVERVVVDAVLDGLREVRHVTEGAPRKTTRAVNRTFAIKK